MKKRHIVAATFILATAAGAGPASADTKNYPAIGCRYTGGGSPQYANGAIRNTSTSSSVELMCPFIRDLSQISSGSITYVDRHPSFSNNCHVWSELPATDGSGVVFHDAETVGPTSGSSPNAIVLTFGALAAGDYYYATCRVAPRSSNNHSQLVNFSITES